MFVTDHFVFLHLPKTAGVYVESVCKFDLEMPIHHTRRHAVVSELPEQYQHLPKIGVWRNPWEWHASLYYFARANKNEATSEIMQLASENFKWGFEDTLERLMSPDEKLLRDYKERLGQLGRIKDIECLHENSLEKMAASGKGLMSFLAQEIFPEKLDMEWTVENLQQDFFSYIKPFITDRDKLRKALTASPRNRSDKPNLNMIYTSRGLRWVAEKEKDVIEKFNYLPPA